MGRDIERIGGEFKTLAVDSQARFGNTFYVGTGQTIQEVIDACPSPAADNQYEVIVPPGRESEGFAYRAYVLIRQAGRNLDLPEFSGRFTALAGGVPVYGLYRTGSIVKIVYPDFKFTVVGSQVIAGQFSTVAGQTITVDWGDGGAVSTYSGVNQAYNKDYGSAGDRTVTITDCGFMTKFTFTQAGSDIIFDIADLPFGTDYVSTGGDSTVFGNIGNLSSRLNQFMSYGETTYSGNIKNLPEALSVFVLVDNNTVSGKIETLPDEMTAFTCAGAHTISGDIGKLPLGLTIFDCRGLNTIDTYTSRIWTTKPSPFRLTPTGVGGLSTAEMDQLIIDFNTHLDWGVDTITLNGTNAARSSASDAAVTEMEAAGVTFVF